MHLGNTALGKLSRSFYLKHRQGASLTSSKPQKPNSSASLKPPSFLFFYIYNTTKSASGFLL